MEPKVLEIQRTYVKIKPKTPFKKIPLKKKGLKLNKNLNPTKGSFSNQV
jgi:hypothetical protein